MPISGSVRSRRCSRSAASTSPGRCARRSRRSRRHGSLRRSGVPRSADHRRSATGVQPLNFGELEETRGTGISKPGELRLDPAFADVSNLDTDNKVLARDNRRRLYSLGNRLWHSDSSFKAIPATYSLLSGRVVVDKGGETGVRRHARRV